MGPCFGLLLFLLSLGSAHSQLSLPATGHQDQCNKTVGIYEEITSPPLTPENAGKPMLCHYRFRPFRTSLRDWVLRIRFTRFKVGRVHNTSACEGGYIQILDGVNGKVSPNGKDTGKFCGEIEQSQTFISETSTVRLVFYVDNFTDQTFFKFDSRAEQQYEVFQRYGQNPELFPNRRGEVVPGTYCERVFRDCRMNTCFIQSPGFPGFYPRSLHCKYSINTRLPFIQLIMKNEDFSVDAQRCENLMLCPLRSIGTDCPNDYIRVYDGKDERARVIGTFCGIGKFPFSIVGTGADLFVEFVSSGAGPLGVNGGFHFQVGHWPGHIETTGKLNGTCDWIFRSELITTPDKQGLFWSVSHWYPPNTRCSYLLLGEPNEIVRLHFPSFRIEKMAYPILPATTPCAESLTIYDSTFADDSKIIKTFCETSQTPEKTEFVSTGNALYVLFESKTGSYSTSSLTYWSSYDFFDNRKHGKPIPNTECDELFESWSKSEGRFASPFNTLVFGHEDSKGINCKYRFVTVRRLFARIEVKVDRVNFKYNQDTCLNCWLDRVDKVTLSELPGGKRNNKSVCICKENVGSVGGFPVALVSEGEELEVNLKVDPRHAMANYFKFTVPIFEGSYKFIHSPLCGPTKVGPSPDGKLRFPFYFNPALRELPTTCLWELHTTPEKDLWINLEKLVFSVTSKTCADAKLDFYLPASPHQKLEPLLSLCGESNLGSKTEISSQLKIISHDRLKNNPVTIRLETSQASKLNFVISWTELHQLPKNAEKLESCGFLCPGSQICIEKSLVCNGIQNCPNVTGTHDESPDECVTSDSHFVVLNLNLNVSWVTASLVGGGIAFLLGLFCICCCRCCRGGSKGRGGSSSTQEEDYLT